MAPNSSKVATGTFLASLTRTSKCSHGDASCVHATALGHGCQPESAWHSGVIEDTTGPDGFPKYALLYDAVAEGLARNAWQLNRLQSALIGTAFADVELRLADALPRVLRPVLSEMAASQEARETVTIDELRLLVASQVRKTVPVRAGSGRMQVPRVRAWRE
eukprot:TRINITY_DN5416_c0_g1_i3.p1 TRINITY_DN5416_c0_g1~~TRINITY_DN5416_c0_g1_i3.p1  ORF type:complete len:162 (-),score=19.78 TRINITY_DN5416_c0_g1_i3:10-495(-)